MMDMQPIKGYALIYIPPKAFFFICGLSANID
jgi:hypothetical protein